MLLKGAECRLKDKAVENLSKDWCEKGMLNIPSCYMKSTDGIAIGHILWLHNCMKAYGMYEFCKDRYGNLEKTSWSKTKTYEENAKKNLYVGLILCIYVD